MLLCPEIKAVPKILLCLVCLCAFKKLLTDMSRKCSLLLPVAPPAASQLLLLAEHSALWKLMPLWFDETLHGVQSRKAATL